MQKVPTGPDMDEWDRHDRLRDGMRIFVRMLRPDDAALYPDFLAEVTADDMRLRFLAPMRALRRELIGQLTQLDPARAAAFVALMKPPASFWESRVCTMKADWMENTPSWCVPG